MTVDVVASNAGSGTVTATDADSRDAIETRNATPGRRTLWEVEGDPHALTGGRPSGDQRAMRRRWENAARTGETCGACGRAFGAGEVMYRITIFHARGLLGRVSRRIVPHCGGCRAAHESRTWAEIPEDERAVLATAIVRRRPHRMPPLGAPQPCETCGRMVANEASARRRRHTYCSDRCARRGSNRSRNERAVQAREKACAVCGEHFSATRRDAETCGSACRQKRHRRRRAMTEE
jgi:hypothetical protein